MNVLFVTSEIVPLYKLGGLADVSYALPVALRKLGVDITVAMPYYQKISVRSRCIGPLAVDYDGKRELVFVFLATIPGTDVPIYLFRHPLLNDYHGDDIVYRFAFFSKAVTAFYLYAPGVLKKNFDIVHCQDWHTALIPLLLGETNKLKSRQISLQDRGCKTILTIHNLLYQGQAGPPIIKPIGIPEKVFHVRRSELGLEVNALREGIEHADVVTTVSPTYAAEILTKEFGSGLDAVLNNRKNNLVGILNGIDQTIWDPETDPNIPVNYTVSTVKKAKKMIKHGVQQVLGLPIRSVPLFGFVGRLDLRQKGIDILVEAVRRLSKLASKPAFQLAVLGTGGEAGEELLTKLANEFEHVAFVNTFDERLARRIYAGADVMLVPSKFEPCGLTQMIAMRYGTIPLVRMTGGLADSVINGKTGFVFEKYTATELAQKMQIAIEFYESNQTEWADLIARVMKEDFSWDKRAMDYKKLYGKLLRSR